ATTSARSAEINCAGAAGQCDILLAIEHIGDRRSHAAERSGLNIENLFTLVRGVCDETPIRYDLKYEIPGGRYCPAANAGAAIAAPTFLLCDRVPGDKRTALAFNGSRSD